MATSGTGAIWYYKDDFNTWQPYDPNSNTLLENAFKSGNVSINLAKFNRSANYTIDLINFKQQNNIYSTIREVKRGETGTTPFSRLAQPISSSVFIDPHSTAVLSLPVRVPIVPGANKPIISQTAAIHRMAAVPFTAVAKPKSGTIPAKPPTTTSTTYATPYAYGGKSIVPPFNDSSVSLEATPMPLPRNKKKSRTELKKSTRYDTFFSKYTETKKSDIPKDETCPICLTPLLEPGDVDPPKSSASSGLPKDEVLALKKCSHMFHTICIGTMLDSISAGKLDELSISCPICQTIHGVKTGDQPITGSMNVSYDKYSVPGFEGNSTIIVQYDFSDGITENGTKYHAASFPRVCYIPDNAEGRLVLELLRLAWKRRLIFTIGTSVTTGRANCIVWNNIHHKTEPHSNSSGHGYPDPNFLKNIKMELAVQGVIEEELT